MAKETLKIFSSEIVVSFIQNHLAEIVIGDLLSKDVALKNSPDNDSKAEVNL